MICAYDQLSPEKQERAIAHILNDLVDAVVTGGLRFNDCANGTQLQARIDEAWRVVYRHSVEEDEQPMWVRELVRDWCYDDLEAIAISTARQAKYADRETVIDLALI